MNAREYILSKQIQWAYRNNIVLIGSKNNKGRKAYTQKLDDNLFEPLMSEVKSDFEGADGGELGGNPYKMQAVHSSSCIGCEYFPILEKE